MNGDIVTENIQILPYTYLNKKTKHLKENNNYIVRTDIFDIYDDLWDTEMHLYVIINIELHFLKSLYT